MKIPLAPKYRNFCIFESVAINGVGCTSLTLQDTLREHLPHPGFYEYWFSNQISQTEPEHLMIFMIAGWLFTAGSLQAFINFDLKVPRRTKLGALYTFFVCDLIWIVLMIEYTKFFSMYHIVGSMYTITQRTQFVFHPQQIFIDATNSSMFG